MPAERRILNTIRPYRDCPATTILASGRNCGIWGGSLFFRIAAGKWQLRFCDIDVATEFIDVLVAVGLEGDER